MLHSAYTVYARTEDSDQLLGFLLPRDDVTDWGDTRGARGRLAVSASQARPLLIEFQEDEVFGLGISVSCEPMSWYRHNGFDTQIGEPHTIFVLCRTRSNGRYPTPQTLELMTCPLLSPGRWEGLMNTLESDRTH